MVLQKSSADTERRGGAGERSSPALRRKRAANEICSPFAAPGAQSRRAPMKREELKIQSVTIGNPKRGCDNAGNQQHGGDNQKKERHHEVRTGKVPPILFMITPPICHKLYTKKKRV